ncbi:MAG: hypothetical protein ACOYMZ_01250 [Minisyncoccia bacterium]
MTLRRILTITIILLVLAGLLFGASWFFSRRTAEKNGTTPLTFRQFLGIGTPAVPGQTVKNEFVSQFTIDTTADKNSNGILDGEEDLNFNGSLDKNDIVISASGQKAQRFNDSVRSSIDVKAIVFSRFGDTNTNTINDWNEDLDNNGEIDGVEDKDGNDIIDGYDTGGLGNPDGGNDAGGPGDNGGFTGGPLMPTGGNPTSGGTIGEGAGTTPGGSSVDTTGEQAPDPVIPPTTTTPVAANSCSDADTNIAFTPAEIARLNTLKARFDQIADTLYDDAAGGEQRAFYDSFKIKEQQTQELVNFCEQRVSSLGSEAMRRRVPTPFYHDTSRDSNTFTNGNGSVIERRPYLENPSVVTALIERLLRINIW